MKYVVKMKRTIIEEYEVVIPDDFASNVIEAMDIAEDLMQGPEPEDNGIIIVTYNGWSVASVTTKE